MRVAVVGHVEWIEFARTDHVPTSGEIVHATEAWEEPGGGGAVAAVQLAKLAGGCDFFTAVGGDELGRRSVRELTALGLDVHAVVRPGRPTRKAVTFVNPGGERTITTLGERLHPEANDALPWDRLDGAGAVYVTASDPPALRLARRARVLVVTSRVLDLPAASGVRADAVVGSARDPSERYEAPALAEPPGLVVLTEGAGGGSWLTDGGERGRFDPAPLPGPVSDTYGGGDSFAAGLTFGLAAGLAPEEAIALAARCGAAAVTGRGPFGGQLTAADL